MSSLNRYCTFNAGAQGLGRALTGFLVGWLKHGLKGGPPRAKWKFQTCFCLMQRKGFKGFGRLECLSGLSFKTHSPTPGGSRRHTSTITVRSKFVKGAPASTMALLCSSDLTAGSAVTESGSLHATGIIGSQSGRGQTEVTAKSRVGIVTVVDRV